MVTCTAMPSGILLVTLPFASQKSVHFRIDEFPPLQQMLALASLIAHAQFLQNVARRRIVLEVCGKNAVQLEIFKTVTQHFARCLGGIAPSPVRRTQPVPKLRMLMRFLDSQTNAPDLSAVVPQCDCQPHFSGLFGKLQKRSSILLCVRMRDS